MRWQGEVLPTQKLLKHRLDVLVEEVLLRGLFGQAPGGQHSNNTGGTQGATLAGGTHAGSSDGIRKHKGRVDFEIHAPLMPQSFDLFIFRCAGRFPLR